MPTSMLKLALLSSRGSSSSRARHITADSSTFESPDTRNLGTRTMGEKLRGKRWLIVATSVLEVYGIPP